MARQRFRPKPLTSRRKILLAAAVGIPLLAIFTVGDRGLLKRFSLESHRSDLRDEITRERAVGDSLRSEIDRMTNDTLAVEEVARERYGMVRPGERVYKIPEGE